MKLYTEKSVFADALKSIVSCGKRLDKSIQQFAVSAALHAVVNSNPCHINDLIENMPKGSRGNAIKDWFTTFGPVAWNAKTSKFDLDKDLRDDGQAQLKAGADLPEVIAVAILTPWTDFAPDPKYHPMDLVAVIMKAVNEAQKRLDKDAGKGDKIDPKLLAELKTLVTAD